MGERQLVEEVFLRDMEMTKPEAVEQFRNIVGIFIGTA